MSKKKKFNRIKHLKSLSRVLLDVKPTKIIRSTKNRLLNKEVKKEIDEFIKG